MRGFSVQALSAGLLSAFVGFASSFAVVVQGLTAVGATPAQATSGLMAAAIAMGLAGIVASLRTRMPVSVAWSTPGAALLASTGPVEGGFAAAVGAFLVTGGLIVLAGLWRPLGRWVAAIPAPLANAMLGGVLLGLCLAPVRALGPSPTFVLPVIVAWALVARWKRLYAVPVAVLLAMALVVASRGGAPIEAAALRPAPELVAPVLSLAGVIGIALPLFIVTMASQNIPGLTVLHVNGYRPDAGPLLRLTGLFTIAAAPLGCHAVNLAAITAALCAAPDAHPDPARRWWAAVVAGIGYVLFGVMAGGAVAVVAAAPPLLIEAVAGLALLGAFGNAVGSALAEPESREAAVVTFLVTASGITLLGIGGAFWGLLAGGAILTLTRLGRRG